MSTDDVRRGLRDLADEAPEADPAALLAGVEAANKTHRRRVTAAAATGIVAVVAAAAFAVPQVWNRGDGPTPPANQTAGTTDGDGQGDVTPLPTELDHGIRFFAEPAGNPLLGHGVGAPGQADVAFSFTPSTTDLLTDVVCTAPQFAGSSGRVYAAHLAVNGRYVGQSACGDLANPPRGTDQGWLRSDTADNESQWEQRGVVVGQATTVRVWLSDRRGADAPAVTVSGAQVGAAFWGHDVPVERQQGVEVDTAVERSGAEFDLFDVTCQRLQEGRAAVSVDLADLPGPALIERAGTALAGSALGGVVGDPPPATPITTSTRLVGDPPETVRHAVRGSAGEQGWICLSVYSPRR